MITLYPSSVASRAEDSQQIFVTAPAISRVSIPSGPSRSFRSHLPGKNALAPDLNAKRSSSLCWSSRHSRVPGPFGCPSLKYRVASSTPRMASKLGGMTDIVDNTHATTAPLSRTALATALTVGAMRLHWSSPPTVASSRSITTSAVLDASMVSNACKRPRRRTTLSTIFCGMPLGCSRRPFSPASKSMISFHDTNRVRVNPRAHLPAHFQPNFSAINSRPFNRVTELVGFNLVNHLAVEEEFDQTCRRRFQSYLHPVHEIQFVAHHTGSFAAVLRYEGEPGRVAEPVVSDVSAGLTERLSH